MGINRVYVSRDVRVEFEVQWYSSAYLQPW